MAKIKLGATVVGIRGTIGGITYSANGSGTFAKAWQTGPFRRTLKVTNQRIRWARLPQEWRALTDVQRAAWDTYAAAGAQALTDSLGQTYYASGFNWFIKINSQLLFSGQATRTAPPSLPALNSPPILTCTVNTNPAATSRVTFTLGSFLAADYGLVFVQPSNTQSRLIGPPLILFVKYDTNLDVQTRINFQGNIHAVLGTLQLGQRMFLTLVRQNAHGRRGAVSVNYCDTVTT